MASTTPLPPSSQSQSPSQLPTQSSQEQLRQAQFNTLLTYTSLTLLLVCPTLIALPPRKFDFYTVLLISGTAVGGNQVLREYTGRGIAEHVPPLRRLLGDGDAGGRVQDERVRGVEERVGRKDFGTGTGTRIGGENAEQAQETTTEAVARAVREMKAAEGPRERGIQGGVLEGAEQAETLRQRKAVWKVQRDAREKEALEDGRGYGGLIMDQIWEVWNWGSGTKDGKEGDGLEKSVEVNVKGKKEGRRK